MAQIIQSLDEISERYDALLVDLWGCVHNGIAAFPAAVSALQTYRKRGGAVVLLTNAPRPRSDVALQLERMGVPEDAWDTICTSGDSARTALFSGAVGPDVFFIGDAARDARFFDPIGVVANPTPIRKVPLEHASGIVCTGPFDPSADPSVLRPELLYAKEHGLKLLCANPDIVVDRGEIREWCAGAIAQLYAEMGGESLYFGKPHAPIYELARLRLNAEGHEPAPDRILAIGDGILTDIAGAVGEGIDSLFITGGLAAAETKTAQHPDRDALDAYLQQQACQPTYAIGFLR